jgi:death-on-curing protein
MFGIFSDVEQDLDIICRLHDEIIEASGGAKGIHSEHLLKSALALARPLQTAFGDETYKDTFSKAAALLDSIANNHGFRDGNKRTAMAAANLFLYLQEDINVQFSNQEYEDFMIYVVTSKPPVTEIASWLKVHTIKE